MNYSILMPLILALIAGAMLPIQSAISARLGESLQNPMSSTLFSFVTGGIGMALYALVTRMSFATVSTVWRSEPWYIWSGGLLGAVYVGSTIWLIPRLGVPLTFALVTAGQMLLSIAMEHYGFLGAVPKPASFQSIIGILLVIVGVVLILTRK